MTARIAALGRRTFDLLASLRVGVITMVVLAAVCGVATFYESSHGTPAVQRAVYQTRWFTLLLALLGVNILFSMLRRYPWTRHQAGFVIAHVGIVLLLAGSLVSLHLGLDGTIALYEGQGTGTVALREPALDAQVGARHVSHPVPVDAGAPRTDRPLVVPIEGTPVTVVADAYAAHVEVSETVEPADEGPAAVSFALDGQLGHDKGWLVAGGDRAHADLGPLHVHLAAAATEEEAHAALGAAGEGDQIAIVVGPGRALRYALRSGASSPTTGLVAIGRPITTPWMGLALTVNEVLAHSASRRTVAPAAVPDREDRRQPAVRVRFDSPAGGTASEWVPWGETLEADLAEGHAAVSFGERQAPLPFRLTLLQFQAKTYPGSRMPASYESRVRLERPDGTASEHLISMNHPLHQDGYVFFQASYVEGEPMMSILSVSRSPGLPLVYLGTALVSLGVAWMFYVKPWLARRQARRAAQRRAEWAGPVAEVTP